MRGGGNSGRWTGGRQRSGNLLTPACRGEIDRRVPSGSAPMRWGLGGVWAKDSQGHAAGAPLAGTEWPRGSREVNCIQISKGQAAVEPANGIPGRTTGDLARAAATVGPDAGGGSGLRQAGASVAQVRQWSAGAGGRRNGWRARIGRERQGRVVFRHPQEGRFGAKEVDTKSCGGREHNLRAAKQGICGRRRNVIRWAS